MADISIGDNIPRRHIPRSSPPPPLPCVIVPHPPLSQSHDNTPTLFQPSKPHSHIHILSLPPEIRLRIWTLTLQQPTQPIRPRPRLPSPASSPTTSLRRIDAHLHLLLVCHSLTTEALPIYYAANTFSFSNTSFLTEFLRILPRVRRQALRRVVVDVGWNAHWNLAANLGEQEENEGEVLGDVAEKEMEVGERMVVEVRKRGVVRVRVTGREALAVWKRVVVGGGGMSSTERYRGDRRWVEGIRALACAEVVG